MHISCAMHMARMNMRLRLSALPGRWWWSICHSCGRPRTQSACMQASARAAAQNRMSSTPHWSAQRARMRACVALSASVTFDLTSMLALMGYDAWLRVEHWHSRARGRFAFPFLSFHISCILFVTITLFAAVPRTCESATWQTMLVPSPTHASVARDPLYIELLQLQLPLQDHWAGPDSFFEYSSR